MLATPKHLVGNRYQIQDEIGHGGMSVVYRAFDRLTRRVVALKYIEPAEQHALQDLSVDYRLVLANEFRLLTSLNHPNVVSVLDYGFDDKKQPYFTMELLPDSRSIIEIANEDANDVWIDLLVQLFQAVIYLHRRGIIHRDLKPDNIRVIQDKNETYHLKLIDFGIAEVSGRLEIDDTSTDTLAGSFAYMAPEIINGLHYSEQSDIYALGLIIYEVITGYYAFPHSGIASLLQSILTTTPDLDIPEIDPLFTVILEQALAIDMNIRYKKVSDLSHDLQNATQRLVSDNIEIRESYIQAARFVGRENEVQILSDALKRATNSEGSFWLVGGESGIGKTRLFNEIRTKALVEGYLVLHGQAAEGGRKLYAMWLDVLRRLILYVELNDFQAQVLKEIIPDISQLLERPVKNPPELEGDDRRKRLANTIVNIFEQVDKPVLLILEDLHWAQEGLFLLRQLSYAVSNMKMLILANYRNEEAPDLPEQLPNHHNILTLEKLSKENLEELCYAMLGQIYIEPNVIDLLWKESEGNAFFLVTVIRALTENSDNLSRIDNIDFTSKTFAGGIQALIRQHIAHLPDEAQRKLQIAALVGQQINLDVMRSIDSAMDYQRWLIQCSNTALLERSDDGSWQFAHNRYRETIRDGLEEADYHKLSQEIAETIEILYPDDFSQYVILAYHWGEAQNNIKELHYALEASEQVIASGSYQDGLRLAQRAKELIELVPTSDESRIRITQMLGEAYYGLGNLSESRKHLEQALRLLNMPDSTANGKIIRGLIVQLLRQFWHRLIPDRLIPSQKYIQQKQRWLRIIQIYEYLQALSYYRNDFLEGMFCALSGLNISEKLGKHALGIQARNSGAISIGFGAVRLSWISDIYIRRISRILADNQLDYSSVIAANYYMGAYSSGQTRWEDAIAFYKKAIEYAGQVGMERRLVESKMFLAATLYVSGNMQEALDHANDVYKIASRQHDTQFQALAFATQAEVRLRKGEFELAQQLMEDALAALETLGDIGAVIRVRGMLVRLHLRQNNLRQCENYIQKIKELLTDKLGLRFGVMEGFIGLAEYHLVKWATDITNTEYQTEADVACQRLEIFGNRYQSGKPIALILRARYYKLTLDDKNAQKLITKAISVAQQLKMPYEEGLATYYQGDWLSVGNHKQQILEEALTIFTNLGAEWDIRQTQKILGQDYDAIEDV